MVIVPERSVNCPIYRLSGYPLSGSELAVEALQFDFIPEILDCLFLHFWRRKAGMLIGSNNHFPATAGRCGNHLDLIAHSLPHLTHSHDYGG